MKVPAHAEVEDCADVDDEQQGAHHWQRQHWTQTLLLETIIKVLQ